ncbi:hypothetical protein Tco_0994487, partial [Tanacetum coccineum]
MLVKVGHGVVVTHEVFVEAAKHQSDRLMAFMDLIGSKRDRLITVSCLSERNRLIVVMLCVRIEHERLNVDCMLACMIVRCELHENTEDRE